MSGNTWTAKDLAGPVNSVGANSIIIGSAIALDAACSATVGKNSVTAKDVTVKIVNHYSQSITTTYTISVIVLEI